VGHGDLPEGERLTSAQDLETLSREVGDDVPDDLTKARASEMIDDLRNTSPRIDS
jgi:hypothetical protein